MSEAEKEAVSGEELRQIAAPDGLDAVAREARKFDEDQAAQLNQVEESPENADTGLGEGYVLGDVQSLADNLAEFLELGIIPVEMAGFSRTAEVWNEETRKQLSCAAVPVLQKYSLGRKFLGWITGGVSVEEIKLLMLVHGLYKLTAEAVRLDIEDRKAKAAKVVQEPVSA